MFRAFSVGILLLSMCLFILATDKVYKIESKDDISFVTIVNENKELFDQSEVFESVAPQNVDGLMHYAIGARRASDQLVASGGQNNSWPAPHNAQIALQYPTQGFGASVTYVAVVVNQTSKLGQAYVLRGGINQRTITVIVEAYNTMVFNVFAYIYGVA